MFTTFILVQIITLNAAFNAKNRDKVNFILIGLLNLVTAFCFNEPVGYYLYGTSGILWIVFETYIIKKLNRN